MLAIPVTVIMWQLLRPVNPTVALKAIAVLKPPASRPFQLVERDLGRAIEAYSNDASAGAYGRICLQVSVFPGTCAHVAWKHRIEREGDAAGQADLAPVCMTAQHDVETGMRSLPVYFRSM